MNSILQFDIIVNKENNTIQVNREFAANLDLVWAAWTEADILDQWWAPKPYMTITKSLDLREGGRWHYYMLSPTGEKHYCLFDYEVIRPMKYFSGIDAFCDENAVMNNTKPRVRWGSNFTEKENTTLVNIELHFDTLEDLETILQMGFKEGFTAGLENLEQYIAAQFYLRKKTKILMQLWK